MRISIDATGLGTVKTGTAVYVAEILRCWNADPTLDHDFVIFASPKAIPYLHDIGLDSRFSFVEAPDSRVIRIFWQQLDLPRLLRKLRVDVHWGSGFVLPLLGTTPMIVTIHDLTFKLFPAAHEPVKRWYFPMMIRAAVRKAKHVIAVSATTEHDLCTLVPSSRGKTSVTLLAPRKFTDVGPSEAASSDLLGDRYIVFIGTMEPRKNLERLIEAWFGLDAHVRQDMKLVIVGMRGWMMDELLARYEEASTSVVFTGFVDDSRLQQLMRGAMALAYPSLYEGFGLPVIEAMAEGVPVLTSDVGATREIAAEAAMLVDPMSVAAIRNGLSRMISDDRLRRQLSERGRQRAAKFSWKRTADQTIRVLEAALA